MYIFDRIALRAAHSRRTDGVVQFYTTLLSFMGGRETATVGPFRIDVRGENPRRLVVRRGSAVVANLGGWLRNGEIEGAWHPRLASQVMDQVRSRA